tara:strand:- start:15 stop:230 length:216 start_codon:yes stop_codon:yes gene_type:complete
MIILIKPIEQTKEPIAPLIVLFGLIFDNFGPLITLPKTNPPISEATHVSRITKIKIFKYKDVEKVKNNKKK